MLWIGLIARDAGTSPSRRLGIRDEVAALGFDAAVSLRLLTFDNERARVQARLIAYEVGKLFGGADDDDVLDSPVIRDKYSDGSTQVW